MEGLLHCKEFGKKSWSKKFIFLRGSGLYSSSKSKSKVESQLVSFFSPVSDKLPPPRPSRKFPPPTTQGKADYHVICDKVFARIPLAQSYVLTILDSFSCRHDKLSVIVITVTAQNGNKSFTHIEHVPERLAEKIPSLHS